MTHPRRLAVLLVVLAALGAAPATAQTDPRLLSAVKLAQDGKADSARAITRDLLTRIPASDTLYPQALFTAATISATAPEMEKALRRIVVEYPSSEWVDDALLRLSQLDYAGGDVAGAAQKLERLKSDFPNSSLLAPAALWAARSYFELRNRTSACKWLEDGRSRAGADVETANQLAFYQQRCSPQALMADAPTMDTVKLAKGDSVAVPKGAPAKPGKPVASKDSAKAPGKPTLAKDSLKAPAKDSTKAAPKPAVAKDSATAPVTVAKVDTAVAGKTPVAPNAASAKPAAAASFRLQIAAMPTPEQATSMVASLKAKGVTADITKEGVFHKVRTGRYPTRAAAAAALPGVQQKVGSAPFIVREGT